MNALIQINDDNGRQTVSARELHQSLEIGTEFAKWCKRMFEYGFVEGQDYAQVFLKNGENLDSELSSKMTKNNRGRPEADYALTLDCAKEIAMLQRSEQGRRLRQYFIEAEKQLRQVAQLAPASASVELQLKQAQILTDHAQRITEQGQQLTTQQHQLAELEETVRQIMAGYHPPVRRLSGRPQIPSKAREVTTRKQLNDIVNAYCARQGVSQKETWEWLYDELYRRFSVILRGYRVKPGVSLLEVAEQFGHLDKLYSIVMSELYYNEYHP